MEKINNYWIDKNNNRWDCDIYTELHAEQYSQSLLHCTDCTECTNCSGCSGCSCCSRCFNCAGCSGCSGCLDFENNPQRYITPKGGRDSRNTTMYYLDGNIQIVCGCFQGDLEDFEKAVKETHGNNEHGKFYKKQIRIMKYLIKNSGV